MIKVSNTSSTGKYLSYVRIYKDSKLMAEVCLGKTNNPLIYLQLIEVKSKFLDSLSAQLNSLDDSVFNSDDYEVLQNEFNLKLFKEQK